MRTEDSTPYCRMGHGTERTGSRWQLLHALAGLSLWGPLAASRFATATPMTPSVRIAQAPSTPTTRAGGGTLRLLWWQAPTIANVHLSTGMKDNDASRVVQEPLASFNRDGALVPILAEAIPSVDNGGLTRDGTSVTCA